MASGCGGLLSACLPLPCRAQFSGLRPGQAHLASGFQKGQGRGEVRGEGVAVASLHHEGWGIATVMRPAVDNLRKQGGGQARVMGEGSKLRVCDSDGSRFGQFSGGVPKPCHEHHLQRGLCRMVVVPTDEAREVDDGDKSAVFRRCPRLARVEAVDEVRISGFYLVGRLDRTVGPKAGFGGVAVYAHNSVANIGLLSYSDTAERMWCILHTHLGVFLL